MIARTLTRVAAYLLLLSSLTACGGGNGAGTTGNPTPAAYTIGGTLSGLSNGTGIAVTVKSGNETLTLTQNGSFAFSTNEPDGVAYDVTVSAQPQFPQRCNVTNGSGVVSGANVTNISVTCSAQISETVLYSFLGGPMDGGTPCAAVVFDDQGDLYGTTEYGGSASDGTLFELEPDGIGGYTETVLHNFLGGMDGNAPCATLTLDKQGNIYGTTSFGGSAGDGTVFEFKPDGSGGFTESVLHSFTGGNGDGASPAGTLIFDSQGNLYGATAAGGPANSGTIFELKPDASGGYTESILYEFAGSDGSSPGSLVLDLTGNLYGITAGGGTANLGTVYELSPNGSGGYTESVLHDFDGGSSDGAGPDDLIIDSQGNLYGSTLGGGPLDAPGEPGGEGTVFELKLNAGGGYTESMLYGFSGLLNGDRLNSVIRDGQGNLFGTVWGANENGLAFELQPSGTGSYSETTLYVFDDMIDGGPLAGLTFDTQGNLYGTTGNGGTTGWGTVFEIQ